MTALGFLEGVPAFWILAAIPVAVAGLVTFLLRFSEWRVRITPENKFHFQGIVLGGEYQKDGSNVTIGVTGIQIKLLFNTTASFPIRFIVEDFHSSFENRIPPANPRYDSGAVVGIGEVKFYSDHLIDMTGLALKQSCEGTARFTIRYGRPGREKFRITKNLRFQAFLEPKVGGYVVTNWQDLAQ
jgi:hypothetical protein